MSRSNLLCLMTATQLLIVALSASENIGQQNTSVTRGNANPGLWFRTAACEKTNSKRLKTCQSSGQSVEKNGIEVMQGNAKAKSITLGSDDYLFTRDLTPCIAILIVDEKNNRCHMIHMDAFGVRGIGGSSVKTVFNKLGLNSKEPYQIGLIGGETLDSIKTAEYRIKELLPNAHLILKEQGKHTAYLSGQGVMASTRLAFDNASHDTKNRKP